MIATHLIPPAVARAVAVLLVFLFAGSAGAQISPVGRLINGGSVQGRISPAFEVDTFAFQAQAGESIVLNIVELAGISFDPQVNIYKPAVPCSLYCRRHLHSEALPTLCSSQNSRMVFPHASYLRRRSSF